MTIEESSTNVIQAPVSLQEVTENFTHISQVAGKIAGESEEINHISPDLSESGSKVDSSSFELGSLALELASVAKRFTE